MDKTAPVEKSSKSEEKSASSAVQKPVASAKDAINARFAASKTAPSVPKTASNLHSHTVKEKHRLESVRPSASSLLHTSKPQPSRTVVRTSLKLSPKRTPAVSPRSRTNTANQVANALRPAKQPTRLAMDMMNRPHPKKLTENAKTAAAVAAIKAAAAAATPVVPVKKSSTPPNTSSSSARPVRFIDDFKRPSHPATAPNTAKNPSEDSSLLPVDAPSGTPSLTLKSRQKSSAAKLKSRPLDSIKNRFRPAPKGFATSDPKEARPYRVEDFLNPSKSVSASEPSNDDDTVHFYGMTEGPEKPVEAPTPTASEAELADVPAWANPSVRSKTPSEGDLGVVEDYRPKPGEVTPIAPSEDPIPVNKKASPDNNRYALGAQSPYFLKSVKVDKRPLSDSSPLPRRETENPVYAAQSLAEEPSKKNVYEKKPKSKKPSKKSEPTVIVPSRGRSHAPLFGLLILTIILGAVVGAAAYLFFFQ